MKNDISSIVQFTANIARFHIRTLRHLDDLKSQNSKKIYYCIDSSIVHAWVDPIEKIVLRDYSIFPDEKAGEQDEILKIICGFIFSVLSKQNSLYLLPGHDEEFRNKYHALLKLQESVANSGLENIGAGTLNELRKLYDDFVAADSDKDKEAVLNREMEDWLKYLLETTDSVSYKCKLFSELLEGKALKTTYYTPISDQLYGDAKNFRDEILESINRYDWTKRLSSNGFQIANDVKALATLEQMNNILNPIGASVVLITASDHLFKAASTYTPAWASENFSKLFLRHPHCFFSDPDIFSSAKVRQKSQDFGILDVFLRNLPKQLSHRDGLYELAQGEKVAIEELQNFLRNEVLPFDSGFSARLAKLRKNIRKHVSSAHTGNAWEHAFHNLHLILEDFDDEKDDFRSYIFDVFDERVDSNYERLLDNLVYGGYELLIAAPEEDQNKTRNSPPIDFYSIPTATRFVRELAKDSDFQERFDRNSIENIWSAIETEDRDLHGYGKLLCYASIFANWEKWEIAYDLAKRALNRIRIGRGKEVDATRFSGREAFYFLACVKRVLALDSSDLDEVDLLLSDAKKALDSERKGDDERESAIVRIDLERLATEIQRILFRISGEGSDLVPYDSELEFLSDMTAEVGNSILTIGSLDRDQLFRQTLLRRAYINLFTIDSMIGLAGRANPLGEKRMADISTEFLANINFEDEEGGHLEGSYLAHCLSVYAESKYLSPATTRNRILKKELQSLSLNPKLVMNYDRVRHDILHNQTKEYLGKSRKI